VEELKEREWGLGFTSTATFTIQSPKTGFTGRATFTIQSPETTTKA
jgi:hypothetical protein